MTKADPIALVDAAYDGETNDEAWHRGLLDATLALLPHAAFGTSFSADMSNPAARQFTLPVIVGLPPAMAPKILESMLEGDADEANRVVGKRAKISTLRGELRGAPPRTLGRAVEMALRFAHDNFGCIALDAEGRGVILSIGVGEGFSLTRPMRAQWELLSAHLAAAERLRRRRRQAEPGADECVLSPGGKVVHAEGDATPAAVRERLRAAVVARDRAHTRAVRASPEEALSMWGGLVSGRWSLVDRFERDGRRFVVARKNAPDPSMPLALDLRERQVLGHMVQGDSAKLTAYTLGVTSSTVSATRRTVLLKLGVRSVAELGALLGAANAAGGPTP